MALDSPGESRGPAFRADPDAVYRYVARFFEAAADAGVEHVVVSPGSRSTPLAIASELSGRLRTWIQLDERAAGFFALGLAKASGRPAILVCTSGTAAANYLPAIVEAHHARVPLIVATADRPSELRDFGAGQTIDQTGLYGPHPRWRVEVPIPEAGPEALQHAALLAARAVEQAGARPAGAVHLNWPLREPLAPTPTALAALRAGRGKASDGVGDHRPIVASGDPAIESASGRGLRFSRAEPTADARDVEELAALVARSPRGVVCAGPMAPDDRLAAAIARFASRAGWPLLADPGASLRGGPWVDDSLVLASGDLLARAPGFAADHRPEVVVRIGDPPVSKAQRLWLEAAKPAAVWWLEEGGQWGEPSRQATRVVRGGAASLLDAVVERLPVARQGRSSWSAAFASASRRGNAALDQALAEVGAFGGLAVARGLARAMPSGSPLFVSNSMPIRLLDLALACRSEPLPVFCNRGASGIDGVTSTALGVAAAAGRPSVLFTGDLAFLHDLSGLLLTRRETIPLAIVVLDDDGGGIFSFLPIAEQGEAVAFDRLFRTPHGLELARVAALFELAHHAVASAPELEGALATALARPGVSLIHARVDAKANAERFRAAVGRAVASIDAERAS